MTVAIAETHKRRPEASMGSEVLGGHMHAAERGIQYSLAQSIVNACVAKIETRKLPNGDESNHPLEVYDIQGESHTPQYDQYREQATKSVYEMLRSLDVAKEEHHHAGLLLPKIVEALILDDRYIDRVYEPDLPSIVGIAIDWFTHPEEIYQTHIRIGEGGESQLTSRRLAYETGALRSMEKVREMYARYTNYAIEHELNNRLDAVATSLFPKRSQKLERNAYIQSFQHKINIAKLRTLEKRGVNIAVKFSLDVSRIDDPDYADTVNAAVGVPEMETFEGTMLALAETREILIDAWSSVFEEPIDFTNLKQKYHISDHVPTLVVFNASNAAIAINGKDADHVYETRDAAQRLLMNYVREFHPGLEEYILFQNDLPWTSEGEFAKRMLLGYRKDLLVRENGAVRKATEQLNLFAAHHRERGADDTVFGFSPAEVYAILHHEFFADISSVNPGELRDAVPDIGIMDTHFTGVSVLNGEMQEASFVHRTPKHVLYHQGPPEMVFGIYRNILREKDSLTGWTKWLDEQVRMSQLQYADMADAIDLLANQYLADKPANQFAGIYGRAMNELFNASDSIVKRIVVDSSGVITLQSQQANGRETPQLISEESFVHFFQIKRNEFSIEEAALPVMEQQSLLRNRVKVEISKARAFFAEILQDPHFTRPKKDNLIRSLQSKLSQVDGNVTDEALDEIEAIVGTIKAFDGSIEVTSDDFDQFDAAVSNLASITDIADIEERIRIIRTVSEKMTIAEKVSSYNPHAVWEKYKGRLVRYEEADVVKMIEFSAGLKAYQTRMHKSHADFKDHVTFGRILTDENGEVVTDKNGNPVPSALEVLRQNPGLYETMHTTHSLVMSTRVGNTPVYYEVMGSDTILNPGDKRSFMIAAYESQIRYLPIRLKSVRSSIATLEKMLPAGTMARDIQNEMEFGMAFMAKDFIVRDLYTIARLEFDQVVGAKTPSAVQAEAQEIFQKILAQYPAEDIKGALEYTQSFVVSEMIVAQDKAEWAYYDYCLFLEDIAASVGIDVPSEKQDAEGRKKALYEADAYWSEFLAQNFYISN